MTAQIRTEFYFNGTRYFLIDSEFDKYLLDQTVFTIPIDFDHEGVCTANWKGYYVTYFLENRSLYGVLHEFLNDEDSYGLTVKDKISKILTFRIPYYVGPLNQHSPRSWMERKIMV